MPAPTEHIDLRNYTRLLLLGKIQEGDHEPRPVRLLLDRSLGVWIGARDKQDILRVRPFESLNPVAGVPINGTTTVYTSTNAKSRISIDIVNSANASGVTVSVVRDVDGTGTFRDLCGSSTPVPIGVGIRIGTFDLDAGGIIQATCSPNGSVTINVTVDRYNPVGDTP